MTCMWRAVPFLLVGTILATLVTPRPVGAALWDPFADDAGGSFFDEAVGLLRNLLAQIEAITGRTVSRYRLPNRSYIGFQSPEAYVPPREAPSGKFRFPVSRFLELLAPKPAPADQPSLGKICGGGPGDAWWASDCSCHCRQPCPENPDVPCEACKPITHGDKKTTQADCLATKRGHFRSGNGGDPTLEGHF